MSKKYACLFPGQGSQYVGMGHDFYQQFPSARQVFEEADDLLKMSLSKLIFEGPSDRLTETRFSQLAIFVNSMALLKVLHQQFGGMHPYVCAGLSLGEYTALCAAHKLSFKDALKLVEARGAAMHEASIKHPGGLCVVLGLDVDQVETAIKNLEGVWIANLNCPKQVVISGKHEALKEAADKLKEVGAKRVLPLDVSGAFHSGLMQDAKIKLTPLIESMPIAMSSTYLVMNVPGDFVESPLDMKRYLIDQVVATTRWEKGIKHIDQRGVDLYIEIGCGKTLAGMNKKIEVKAPTISVEKVQDLEELEKALSNFQTI